MAASSAQPPFSYVPKTLVFGTRATYLIGSDQKSRSKPKTLLKVFDRLLAADIRCEEAEISQHGLEADNRCDRVRRQ